MNTEQSSSSDSSLLMNTEQFPSSDDPLLMNTQQSPSSDGPLLMITQLPLLDSMINRDIQRQERHIKIRDYLLKQFGKDGYSVENDQILYCPSLPAAERIFDNCQLFILTGCWIHTGTVEHHRTVAGWKYDMDYTFRFRIGSGETIPQHEATLFARHHPLRCELMRTTPSKHITCCRPSHLAWGSPTMNSRDQTLREDVEKHEEYKKIAQDYRDAVDRLGVRLAMDAVDKLGVTLATTSVKDATKKDDMNNTKTISSSEAESASVIADATAEKDNMDNTKTTSSSEAESDTVIDEPSLNNLDTYEIQDKAKVSVQLSNPSPETNKTNDDKNLSDDENVNDPKDDQTSRPLQEHRE
ncbi:unnamed protein product [Adineta steineri]|uniref:Uncharacterized protein n=1 Tax=Adineta steineri TaxID=433720 RepID=A0A815H592_9BILA|nr:unnamed protein product [Adineta steineri]CAF3979235.1 unnamed protein product [Adineta steineri]